MNKKSHYHCVYNLRYHLVLVAKYRNNVFTNDMLKDLEEIIIDVSKKWFVDMIRFNGEADHIHVLIELNPTIQPSKYICNLKTVTSRLIRKKYLSHIKQFYWGTNALWSRSYCLMTTGEANIDVIRKYIENQKGP